MVGALMPLSFFDTLRHVGPLADGRSWPQIDTPRLYLRVPAIGDYSAWARVRQESRAFLAPSEPAWVKTI